MGWLGEEIGPGVLGSPRCTKNFKTLAMVPVEQALENTEC
jgi:hypothetical protein